MGEGLISILALFHLLKISCKPWFLPRQFSLLYVGLQKVLRLLDEDLPYLSSFGSQQKYSLLLSNRDVWG